MSPAFSLPECALEWGRTVDLLGKQEVDGLARPGEGQATPDLQGSKTLVLRNISRSYTKSMLLAEFADAAWEARDLNYVVLPVDDTTGLNHGHAIIEFVNASAAAAFAAAFHGRPMHLPSLDGAPDVSPATGKDLRDAAMFLSSCGSQRPRQRFCTACGGALDAVRFCPWCGSRALLG